MQKQNIKFLSLQMSNPTPTSNHRAQLYVLAELSADLVKLHDIVGDKLASLMSESGKPVSPPCLVIAMGLSGTSSGALLLKPSVKHGQHLHRIFGLFKTT